MKTILAFLTVGALLLSGGCATTKEENSLTERISKQANLQKEEVSTKRMEQVVQQNSINLSAACIEVVRNAAALEKSTGKQVTPSCIAQERMETERIKRQGYANAESAPIVLPENIEEIRAMSDRDKVCENTVTRAIAAKGTAAILGDRSIENVNIRYDQASQECVVMNAVKEYRRFRPSDFVRPYPWNGYTSDYLNRYPYATGPVPVGIEIGVDTRGWSPYGRAGTYVNDGVIHPRISDHYRKSR